MRQAPTDRGAGLSRGVISAASHPSRVNTEHRKAARCGSAACARLHEVCLEEVLAGGDVVSIVVQSPLPYADCLQGGRGKVVHMTDSCSTCHGAKWQASVTEGVHIDQTGCG